MGDKQQATPPAPAKKPFNLIAVSFFIWLAAVLIYTGIAKDFFKFWVDDAGISFTFVRNIAEGYGSVAHPGGERVEGFSDPTWVYLLAACYKFGGSPFTWSQRLGFVFALATLALLCFFGLLPLADKRRAWPAAAAALLVASNACFVIWNQSGLENGLYAFLLCLSLVLVIRESRAPEARPWSAVSLFLLAITRPEAAAHVAIAGFFLLLTDLFTRRRPSARLFIWAGSFCLLFGGYHLWHYYYYAHIFPNTYYAKVVPHSLEKVKDWDGRGWIYVRSYFNQYGLMPALVLCLPAFLARRTWREALYLALTTLFVIFFPVYAGGDWMRGWRFLSVLVIPLAMMLGLAAFNIAEWFKALTAKQLTAMPAMVIGAALAVGWIALPFALTISGSLDHAEQFAKKKETTFKNIARRVDWWEDIAKRLALRPRDLIMTDMDMGGNSFNWPGMMLDIGYLLDVPMASHRYTKQWPPMMDEYFFRERRPEFIHIRRDWGERTTIPMNPKFQEQYVALPEDEHFGRVPNGNFLRRDLIESDHAPERTIAVEPFSNGLKLVGVEAPAAARPGEKTPIFLIWAATAPLPSLRFQIALVRAGQTPTWQEYEPAMGWLPTSDWKPGAFVREVVMLEAPDTEGRYQLMIGVLGGNSAAETRTLPVEIEVGSTAAQQETDRLLAQARELAARDPAGADLAVGLMRQAERIMGEKSLREETAAIDQARLNTYVTAAQKAADAQSWREAADFLSRAWRIDAKSKPLRDLGWRVAGVLYKMGRHEQAQQNWEAAYQAYSAACRAQPQHAWARRRAEEVRPRRY